MTLREHFRRSNEPVQRSSPKSASFRQRLNTCEKFQVTEKVPSNCAPTASNRTIRTKVAKNQRKSPARPIKVKLGLRPPHRRKIVEERRLYVHHLVAPSFEVSKDSRSFSKIADSAPSIAATAVSELTCLCKKRKKSPSEARTRNRNLVERSESPSKQGSGSLKSEEVSSRRLKSDRKYTEVALCEGVAHTRSKT